MLWAQGVATHGIELRHPIRDVALGARRGDGKPGCRAATVSLPGGNGAAAGMRAGFYIGCSFWYGVLRLISVVRFRWCQAK